MRMADIFTAGSCVYNISGLIRATYIVLLFTCKGIEIHKSILSLRNIIANCQKIFKTYPYKEIEYMYISVHQVILEKVMALLLIRRCRLLYNIYFKHM